MPYLPNIKEVIMATRIWQSADNTTNKTTIDIPAGILSANTQYEFRARHKGAVTGYSDWASKIIRTLASFGYEQLSKLVASDGDASDNFGISVAVSGDGTTVVVGARYDDTIAGTDSGSVYIYKYNGTDWDETKLVASDGAANANFGFSVDVSSDGNTVVVGAYADDDNGPDSGSAYIYKYDGNDWNETKLVASDGAANDWFGISVAVSSDGTTVVVGAIYDDTITGTNSGSAYIYKYDGANWNETKIVASDGAENDNFGNSVAISGDGNTLVVGARFDDGKGSAYIYKYDGTGWDETKLVSDGASEDYFGYSVAVSSDGTTAVVGAIYDDTITGTNSGSAYIYKYDGANWNETKIVASDGAANYNCGTGVAVSGDGTTVVVGAYGANSAYIYKYNGTNYNETKLVASDYFGYSVAISLDSTTIVVGAFGDDDKGTDSGSVYIFKG